MKRLKLFFACLLMAVLSIGQVWATEDPVEITANFQCSCSEAGTSPDLFTATGGSTGANYYSFAPGSAIISNNSYDVDPSQSVSITMNLGTYGGYESGKNDVSFYLVNGDGEQISTAFTSNFTAKYTSNGGKAFSGSVTLNDGQDGKGVYFKFVPVVASGSKYARFHTLSITYTPAAEEVPSYTITAQSNDNSKGTVSLSGSVITGSPKAGFRYASPAYSVSPANSATVSQNGNAFTVTPSANTTVTINFEAIPTYTVSFSTGAGNPAQAAIAETLGGQGITLPAGPTPACSADGWTFAGWAEAAVAFQTTTAPALFAAGTNYKPSNDVTLFAVYKKTETGEVTDQEATETFENQTKESEYNKTKTYEASASNANIAWTMYYGCVSDNVHLTGNQSAQMRWYKSATTTYGYIQNTTPISGLQSVSFNAKTDNGNSSTVKLSVWYSTNGDDWTLVKDNEAAPTTTGSISATINGTVGTDYYVRIGVGDAGTAPSSSSAKLTIDDVQFNFKAAAITTYYLSAPTCSCEQLGTPSVTVTNKTYNSAKLTWAAIANADKYLVKFNGVDQDATENLYFDASDLDPETQYTYQVKALAADGQDDWCDGAFSAEANFTTEEAPDATLTLSERGTTHAYSGSHKVGDVVALPTEAEECNKTFVGWSANASCAVDPEFAPGASYTLAAVSQTLYAVYATPSGTSTWEEIFAVPSAGDYAIYSDGHLMEAAISSNRFQNAAAAVTDGKLDEAPAASCIWTVSINASDYFQFKNGTKYASSTNSNNQGALTEDANDTKAQWTIAYSEGFTIENVGRKAAAGNYTLRNNGDYGWGSYGASTGTAPRLFKKMVTYTDFSTSCEAALADPTFNVDPAEGPFATAQSIELSAAEGTIYYTTNGDNPTSASTEYTDPIVLDACGSTTIKAIAISATNQSGIASATYEIALPIPSVSAEDPYTEAEAIAVYDGGCYNNEDVWVTGTVQTAQFYSSNTYTITLTNGFQFYYFYESYDGENLVPFSSDYIVAGDVLVAKGKLGKHNTTYQIANGYLVSRTPASSKESIANDAEHPYTVAQAIAFCNDPITYDLSESVYVQGVAAGAPNAQGTFNIYDEGAETTLFQLYKSNLGSFDAIKALDVVLAYGKIEKYNSTTYEMNQGEIVDVEVYVAPTVDVTGVTVDATATVQVGKTVQLTATVAPEDATNKNVTWSVKEGDEAYAEVSATGLVTGLAEGEATIIVTTEDGGFTDECVVTVNPISPWATVYTSNVAFVGGGSSHESNSKVVINEVEYPAQKVGSSSNTGTITVTVPAYTHTLHFHAVTWEKKTMTMSITSEDVTNISSPTLAIAADGGAKASGTYTLTGNPVDEYYAITFTPVATEAQIVFGYSSGDDKRIIMYGINQEGGVLPVLDRIEITGTATALEYEIGDVFSPIGLGVNAIYTLNDVEQAPVALDVDENWEGWSFDPAYIGAATESVTVTATYEGKTDSKAVDVTVNVPATPEIVATPASINFGTVNQNAVVAAEGISVTLKGVAAATVALSGEGAAAFSIDKAALTEVNSTINVTPITTTAGTFAATLTISDDANAAEAVEIALSMTVEAPGDNYVKVTAAPTDWSGEYLLVYEDGTNAYVWNGDYNDGANNYASATISSNTIAKPAAAAVITIAAASEGKYTLRVNGDKYFADNGTNSKLIFADAIDDAAEVTISYETDWTKLLFSQRCIRFNSTSGQTRFRFYAADGQQAVQLYKKDTPEPPTPVSEDVRTGLDINRYYTICLPKNVTAATGATFWNLQYRNSGNTEVYLEGVDLPLEAGKPYIFQATAATLNVTYGDETVAAPVENGALRGTFDGLTISEFDAISGNVYILKDNAIRPRKTGENYLEANRAYILYNELEPLPAAGLAPGKRVRAIPMQGQTATGMDNVQGDDVQCTKVLIDGQMYILRANRMYDVTGKLVK